MIPGIHIPGTSAAASGGLEIMMQRSWGAALHTNLYAERVLRPVPELPVRRSRGVGHADVRNPHQYWQSERSGFSLRASQPKRAASSAADLGQMWVRRIRLTQASAPAAPGLLSAPLCTPTIFRLPAHPLTPSSPELPPPTSLFLIVQRRVLRHSGYRRRWATKASTMPDASAIRMHSPSPPR